MSDTSPRPIRKAVLWTLSCVVAVPMLYAVSIGPVAYYDGRVSYIYAHHRDAHYRNTYLVPLYWASQFPVFDPIQDYYFWAGGYGEKAGYEEFERKRRQEWMKSHGY